MVASPKVFISYSHDTVGHQERVLDLADRLRADGIDVEIDQYHDAPPEGWPRWCERQIETADFVLMVCTETYCRRVKGEEAPGKGLGAGWEATIIRQLIYDAGTVSSKFVPVLFSDGTPEHIPTPIKGWTWYAVDSEDGYEKLRRRLAGQPYHGRPSATQVFQVPHPTWFFTGRSQILQDLHRIFTTSGKTETRKIVSLVGTAGVGKSQAAQEYALHHRNDYEVVWWIPAEKETGLVQGLIELARALRPSRVEQANPELTLSALRQWLGKERDWLLILDNAGHPKTVLSFLPDHPAGHTLVTSQLSDWSKIGEELTLDVWSRETSVEFLTKRTRLSDLAGAAALAAELGYLPLALEQAAAYISAAALDFAGYLELYRANFAKLAGDDEFRPENYPNTVMTTWDVSLEAITHDSPVSGDLLRLFAFLAPEDIPRALLSEYAPVLPAPLSEAVGDALALNSLMMPLKRYSLIKATPDSFIVHRLIQAVTMDRMTGSERAHWADAAIALIDAAFPAECTNVALWPTCSQLSPHAEAALTVAMYRNLLPGSDDRITRLVDRLARYLHAMGSFTTATTLLTKAIGRQTEEDLDLARYLIDLVILLHAQGEYAAAIPHCETALRIRRRFLGSVHPGVAECLHYMGRLYRNMGRRQQTMQHSAQAADFFAQAECHLNEALEMRQQTLGPCAVEVTYTLNSMAALYLFEGRFNDALVLVDNVLAMRQALFGFRHPETAHAINHKALILYNMRRYGESEGLFLETLAMREQLLGSDNYEVGTTLHDLAELHRAQRHFKEARALYERALTIRTNVLGSQHELTVATRNALAACRARTIPQDVLGMSKSSGNLN